MKSKISVSMMVLLVTLLLLAALAMIFTASAGAVDPAEKAAFDRVEENTAERSASMIGGSGNVCAIDDPTGSSNTYTTVNAAIADVIDISSPHYGKTIYLIKNDTENVTVVSGMTVKLDLNGFVLKADLKTAKNGSSKVIANNGTLTVYDSRPDITRWFADDNADGCYDVCYDTTPSASVKYLTVKGGCITGGNTSGIYLSSGSTLNIYGGTVVGNYSKYSGGGIYVGNYGTFNLYGGAVVGNYAADGGGIFGHESSVINTYGGTIVGNYATNGGGIYSFRSGTVNVRGGVISGNKADNGGGIYSVANNGFSNSVVNIYGGELSGNSAMYGGGIYSTSGGTVNLNGGTIANNNANSGGGIFSKLGGTVNLNDGTIADNSASYNGGGIYGDNSKIKVSGGVIRGNKAASYSGGGGVYAASGGFTMTGGEISGNIAPMGAGVVAAGVTVGGTAKIFNNTITDSTRPSNLIIRKGSPITIANGVNAPQTDKMKIGVSFIDNTGAFTYGQFTTNGTEADMVCFTSDETVDSVFYDAGGFLKLIPPVCAIDSPASSDIYYTVNNAIAVVNDENNTKLYGKTIYLINDDTENVTVGAGKTVKLDLNGFVLKADLKTANNGKTSVITNSGSLSVYDSRPDVTRWFVDDNADGCYNVVYDTTAEAIPADTPYLTVKGGVITGGIAEYGGGIYSGDNTSLNICGGNIVGNSANYGGGIDGESGSVINIFGGNTVGNMSADFGGGVYTVGNMVLSGGEISGNIAPMRAGVVAADVIVGGTAKIFNNTLTDSTMPSNLIIQKGSPITIADGVNAPQTDKMKIGVSFIDNTGAFTDGQFTTNGTEEDVVCFTSDETVDTVSYDAGGFLKLIPPVCAIDSPASSDIYYTVNSAIADVNDENNTKLYGKTIYLINDDTENVTVGAGKTVKLDLNGFVLKADLKTANNGKTSVITNSGSLSVYDSRPDVTYWFVDDNADGCYNVVYDTAAEVISANMPYLTVKGGVITGGIAEYGGGINNKGILALYGGNIVGNRATQQAGGLWTGQSGVCYMYGGSISGNLSEKMGGAVYTADKFEMRGGEIKNNTALSMGGGVHIYSASSRFTMLGGEISGNVSAKGAGVNMGISSSITIGGTAVISGNIDSNGKANNLCLNDKLTIGSSENAPKNDASGKMNIGVYIYDADTKSSVGGLFTTNGTAADTVYFTADDSVYLVKYDTTAQALYLVLPDAEITAYPSAKSGLTYDGSEQALINGGSAKGGTVYYLCSDSTPTANDSQWSKDIPTGKDAKGYNVWYMVKADTAHSDLAPTLLGEISIGKKTVTVTADSFEINAGDDLPTFTYTASGFIGSDTFAIEPAVSCTANGKTDGTFAITVSGGSVGDNYAPEYVNGTLTVDASNEYVPSTVIISYDGYGIVGVSNNTAVAGEKVTVTPVPDAGYTVGSVTVTDVNGNPVRLNDNGDGTYSFIQPKIGVSKVKVCFEKKSAFRFVDVRESDYYYNAVKWAVEKGVAKGVSDTLFDPNGIVTRAQFVTFLWRAAGCPSAEAKVRFTDVDDDAYYFDAVRWGVARGIINGTTATTFSPNAPVTRAQAVSFLARYAGVADDAEGYSCSFVDVPANAYYANAVAWAAANGITKGKSATVFGVNEKCRRCDAVVFMYRYFGK